MIKSGAFLAIICLFFICCTTEFKEEDHIYSNIKKSELRDDWYFQASIVNKEGQNSKAFLGLSCDNKIIRFDITKDRLLAYIAPVDNTENSKNNPKNLIASFPVLNHHDLEDKKNITSWQEKNYIKVDFSQNFSPNWHCSDLLQNIGSLKISADNSGRNPYKTRINSDYIESTINAIVKPSKDYCESTDDEDCASGIYGIKMSFRKVAKENDYQKLKYPDFEYIYYGTKNDDICIEEEEGCTNIKKLSIYSDNHLEKECDPLKDNPENCFTPTIKKNAQFGFFRSTVKHHDRTKIIGKNEQKEELINRWNIWQKSIDDKGKTIPLEDRVPKKIIYYTSPNFPEDLNNEITQAEKEWDQVFLSAVAKVKNKCTLMNVTKLNNLPQIKGLLTKHNIKNIAPDNLKKSCKIIYDYSKINGVTRFFTGDPEEIKETFGSIFVIRKNNCQIDNVKSFIKENQLDVFLDENNLLETCSLLEEKGFSWQRPGDLRFSFINLIDKKESLGLLGYGPLSADPLTGEIISASANIYNESILQYAEKSAIFMEKFSTIPISKQGKESQETIPYPKTIIDKKNSSYIENKKTDYIFSDLRNNLSNNLFVKNNFKNIFELFKYENNYKNNKDFLSEKSVCFLTDGFDQPFLGLIDQLQDKSHEERVAWLYKRIFKEVVLHELGHTFGLRHNFKGAHDALNFPQGFWGNDGFRDEYRSSSIMTYHKYFNSAFLGLGLYDYAAILFGYGERQEIFDESIDKFVPKRYIDRLHLMTYEDLPYLFSGAEAEKKILEHQKHIKDERSKENDQARMDLKNLNITPNYENFYKRKTLNFLTIKKALLAKNLGVDAGIYPVPYGFCTDRQTRGLDISCDRFIYGSSPSEIIKNAIDDFILWQKLSDKPVQLKPFLERLEAKVYTPILKTMTSLNAYQDPILSAYPLAQDYVKAANHMLSYFSQILQSIEPGEYCQNEENIYIIKNQDTPCEKSIIIDDNLGKRFLSKTNENLSTRVIAPGSIYEKLMAILALSDDNLGFNKFWPKETRRVLGNIFSDNWQNLSPSIKINNEKIDILYKNLFSKEEDQPKENIILSSHSNKLRENSILLSIMNYKHSYNPKWKFYTADGKLKNNNSLYTTSNDETISFTDPYTNKVYIAVKPFGNEENYAYFLIKDLINYYQNTASRSEEKLRNKIKTLEIVYQYSKDYSE